MILRNLVKNSVKGIRTISRCNTWATSEDGSIEYISLTKDLLQPSIKAMQKSYYLNDKICMAFGVPAQPECFPEVDELFLRAAKDGVSIVACEKRTGIVVGALFNKLEEQGTSDDFYQKHIESCKHSASRGMTEWMREVEDIVDIFEYCKVKNAMEMMFVGVIPEYRKSGIAEQLGKVSIDVARSLNDGQNVKVSLDDKKLELGNPPKIVTTITTSSQPQKIVKKLNFKIAAEIDFEKFNSLNKKSVIKTTPLITYSYMTL